MPSIVTADGTQLFYRDWGTGRPVVFVHSMLMSSQMWQHQMHHVVEHGFRAIAYDRRGHGRSDDPGTGYDFDTLADDLAAVLDGLDLSDVTLVGHSMGGGEVIRYLTRHQARRVSRLALVGSTAPKLDVDPASGTALLQTLRDDYGRWVMDNADASFGTGLPGREIPQLEKDRTIHEWMSVSLQAAIACTAANIAADFRPEASRIRLPTLVIHGDSDAFAPLESCGRRSADLIPDSKLVVYRNGSHMLHLSHRPQLNADLLTFVGDHTR
ncbi:alpha/beta hydrolase [Catenulispora sp. NL8]|uniref:Alpha/beta hydrolase n=1 Tax=Catenulispora pinistramenti TaxID=2705254 RepID=A0ABS5KQS1_9ACTN|nr:alpha/beta hydrolase [Catenulispora pinistramenti]MBS2548401.1 alpha/beta hydrolase [Catenulispora pinistramenti]